jgi:hypothetical protein
MSKGLSIISLVLFIVVPYKNYGQKKSGHTQSARCGQITEDSLITLNGTLNLNSTNIIIFENVEKRDRKIHLIPCSNDLRDYVFKTYDSYLYLKGFEEKFWVSVNGKFLTADSLESPPQFLFQFIALTGKPNAQGNSGKKLKKTTK